MIGGRRRRAAGGAELGGGARLGWAEASGWLRGPEAEAPLAGVGRSCGEEEAWAADESRQRRWKMVKGRLK
ncbi:unnamed protein product [Linum trigynum]|uniref:Uncharacterized protein n=1 Tax=Linum trigynum TaxID=586398 RepID=A0AAV2GPV4_9ROSI